MSEEQNDMSIRGLALQNVLIVDAFLRRLLPSAGSVLDDVM